MKFRKLKTKINGITLYVEDGTPINELERILKEGVKLIHREQNIDKAMPEFLRGFGR